MLILEGLLVDKVWKLTNTVRVGLDVRSSHAQTQSTFPDTVCLLLDGRERKKRSFVSNLPFCSRLIRLPLRWEINPWSMYSFLQSVCRFLPSQCRTPWETQFQWEDRFEYACLGRTSLPSSVGPRTLEGGFTGPEGTYSCPSSVRGDRSQPDRLDNRWQTDTDLTVGRNGHRIDSVTAKLTKKIVLTLLALSSVDFCT